MSAEYSDMTKRGEKKRKKKESTDTDTSQCDMSQSNRQQPTQAERDSRNKVRSESKRRKESSSRDRNVQTVLNFPPVYTDTPNAPRRYSDTSDKVLDKLDVLQASSISLTQQMEDCRSSLSKQIDEKIEKLSASIFDLQQENSSLKKTLEQTLRQTHELRDEVKSLRSIVMDQREHLNNLEQYSRRESVRIYGIKGDVRGETSEHCQEKVLRIINEKLKLRDIDSTKISALHRLGKAEKGKDRPVIVRFVSRKDHAAVLRERRNLKNTGIGISEDLTKLNFQRLSRLKQHEGVLEAWSAAGGRLFAKLLDTTIIEIVGGDTNVIDHKLIGHTLNPSRPQQQQRRQQPDRPSHRSEPQWNGNEQRSRHSGPKDHSTPQTTAHPNWSLHRPLQSATPTVADTLAASALNQQGSPPQGGAVNSIQNRLQALADSSSSRIASTQPGVVQFSNSDISQGINKAGDSTHTQNHISATGGESGLEAGGSSSVTDVVVNEPMMQ